MISVYSHFARRCFSQSLRFSSTKRSEVEQLYPVPQDYSKVEISPSDDGRFNGQIPMNTLKFSFLRSSGPGGQHVNKTNSKVQLKFHVDGADWLSESIRRQLKETQRNQISREGWLTLSSDRTRVQALNRAECVDKLRRMLYAADAAVQPPPSPSPETVAKLKAKKESAHRRRVFEKKRHSLKKHLRSDDF